MESKDVGAVPIGTNWIQYSQLAKTETFIGNFLRFGVQVCSCILALGLLISWFIPHPVGFGAGEVSLLMHGGSLGPEQVMTSAVQFGSGLSILDPNAIVSVGLIVLIALPILRVFLTAAVFLIQRDVFYFVLTTLVFVTLLAGIFLGRG